jgi:NAD(P)-dependent dehydrogenase (short-subunit alcohol dehydrogenase family)
MRDLLGYKDKVVIVTGCYSGMGHATAQLLLELGAKVHGLDYQDCTLPLASFIRADLRLPASISAAVQRLPERIDRLFNCAGVPTTFAPIDVLKVNYLGPRLLTDLMVPRLVQGGSIACIASTAGFAWSQHIGLLRELVEKNSYEEGLNWCHEHLNSKQDPYTLSKETVIVWTLLSSERLIRRGIRMNCILPGPTETPFMEKQSTITPAAMIDAFTQPINRRSRPEEQAAALIFLNSEAASYVNGVAMPVDGGFVGGVATGAIDLAKLFQGGVRV